MKLLQKFDRTFFETQCIVTKRVIKQECGSSSIVNGWANYGPRATCISGRWRIL